MTTFENLQAGDTIDGPKFAVSRESIRLFCDASLDYNPLHLDDDYMKGSFGKTHFGGIIMHGMNNFGLISRMITDWAYPAGAIYRRLETRWVKPVKPGDTIQPMGIVKSKQTTEKSRWVLIDVLVRNQNDEKVATGEAMVEFPHEAAVAVSLRTARLARARSRESSQRFTECFEAGWMRAPGMTASFRSVDRRCALASPRR